MSDYLFAEGSGLTQESVTALLAVASFICTAAGGAAVWVATWIRDRKKERETRDDQRERTIVEHLQDQVDKLEARVKHLETDLRVNSEKLTKSVAFAMYAQALMDAKGIKYKPFDLVSDGPAGSSLEHTPLQSGGSDK